MKTTATASILLLTILSPLAASQGVDSDPGTLAKELPSCSSKCISSAFSAAKCASGDWACFCDEQGTTSHSGWDLVADQGTSDCAAEVKPGSGSCSALDIGKTMSTLGLICDSKAVISGVQSSLAGAVSSALSAAASGAPTDSSAGSTTAGGSSSGSGSAASTTAASGSASGSMATAATKAATGSAGVMTSTMSGIAAGLDGNNAGFVLALAAFVLGAMA